MIRNVGDATGHKYEACPKTENGTRPGTHRVSGVNPLGDKAGTRFGTRGVSQSQTPSAERDTGGVEPCAHPEPLEPWLREDGRLTCGVCHPNPGGVPGDGVPLPDQAPEPEGLPNEDRDAVTRAALREGA